MPGELPIPPRITSYSVLTYLPRYSAITAITKAEEAEVTTSTAHQLVDNQIVRFYIPEAYGMREIDRVQGAVLVIDAVTFCVDIDSRSFDDFAIPGAPVQSALAVPTGDFSDNLDAATHNIL